ncbi:MAG: class I SAM-dependent DNA methyltransferase, partial [Hyphomicrobiales bacterium]|nr:class I SAM-dependent DNA methyltransferase [Hyphomicrobiales bacterium]
PPYLGGKKLSKEQIIDMEIAGLSKMKQVDYIGCWFVKATRFCMSINSRFAFVSTSSICQGEQVHLLWSYIFHNGLEIFFAYDPFPWANNAKNNAGVVCTIVGLKKKSDRGLKKIFTEAHNRNVKNISPYLVEGESVFVVPVSKPINNLPEMCMGSNPVDGKNLVVSAFEYQELLRENPRAQQYIKRYMGGNDFMSNMERYCLWIKDDLINQAMEIHFIADRIDKCRQYRLGAGRDAQKVADKPHRFCYRKHQDSDAIIFPKTSAATRTYVPVGFTDENIIINVDAFAIYNPEPYVLALLSSKMHNVWLATTSGRLGSGYRYSVKLSYNNFPTPNLSEMQKQAFEAHTWEIITAREMHIRKTIAWLYDPKTMPENLLAAHKSLDDTLEKIYIGRPFKNDTERLEHLFKLYAEMTADKDKEAVNA